MFRNVSESDKGQDFWKEIERGASSFGQDARRGHQG